MGSHESNVSAMSGGESREGDGESKQAKLVKCAGRKKELRAQDRDQPGRRVDTEKRLITGLPVSLLGCQLLCLN